jgi:hypothetical protein
MGSKSLHKSVKETASKGKPTEPKEENEEERTASLWPSISLAILLTCAAYYNATNGDMVFDDMPAIVDVSVERHGGGNGSF